MFSNFPSHPFLYCNENKYLSKEDKEKGKKLLIFFGNWSMNSCIKGKMSTPGIGMKRLLHSRFEILETDEFRTSKLYNKNFKELTNVKVRNMNILLLWKYYLKHQSRPKEFQRKKQKTNVKKAIKLTEKLTKAQKIKIK